MSNPNQDHSETKTDCWECNGIKPDLWKKRCKKHDEYDFEQNHYIHVFKNARYALDMNTSVCETPEKGQDNE